MIITLIFLSALLAFFLGWVFSRTVNTQPWVAGHGRLQDALPEVLTTPRVGLGVFMAVASSIFALSISAYYMRMEWGQDWGSVPHPGLLWLNTAVLLAASLALQFSWNAGRRDDRAGLQRWLWIGGGLTLAFMGGQWLVWQQLSASGYPVTANPASSFFYLLTALHMLHLLGGFGVWLHTLVRVMRRQSLASVSTPVELCALYWHYLLLIWCVLFALMLTT